MYNPRDYDLPPEDIPAWMRPQYRGIDWAWLLVVILCGIIVLPLATRNGLPPSIEAEREVYRIVELRDGLFAGALYPRWAANLNYGYGSPLFNHLAPLPHYTGGVYSALIGDDPQIAVKIQVIGATLLLGIGFFSFARRRWGDSAGVFGTILLVLSPYFLLTVPYLKTELGLLWALAFFCTGLWSIDRALLLGRGRDMLILGGVIAGVLVTDTGFSPLLFSLLILWAVGQWLAMPSGKWYCVLLGVLSGVGLTAFYYLPAIVDIDAVNWQPIRSYPNAYRVDTIIQSVPPLDRTAYNHAPNLYLGVVVWLFALLGAVVWAVRWSRLKWRAQMNRSDTVAIVYCMLLIIVSLGFILLEPRNLHLWPHQLDPITAFDLAGLAVIGMAVVAMQIIVFLELLFTSTLRLMVAAIILIGIVMASSLTSMYIPIFLELPTPATITPHRNDEARGDVLGTFYDGYFLPTDIDGMPLLPTELPRDIQSLPPNTQVTQRSITDTEYEIFSAQPQPFTVLDFDYPGWEVRRNGERIDSTTNNGLITLQLVQGLNRVEVRFATTPARRISWGISIGAGLLVVLLAAYFEWRDQPVWNVVIYPADWLRQKRRRQQLSALMVGVVMVVLIGMRASPSFITQQTPQGEVPQGINKLDLLVTGIRQNGVSLLGYELNSTRLAAQEPAIFTFYWQANGQRIDSYQVRFNIVRDNIIVDRIEFKHMAIWPTRRWPTDQYMVGVFEVPLPSKPGTYQIVIELGLSTCERSELLPCPDMQLADIYDLRGPTGKQIVLPQPIIVYN